MKYAREFKEEALKLSDEIGVRNASAQLGLPYYTLADWRSQRKQVFGHGIVRCGHHNTSFCVDSKDTPSHNHTHHLRRY